MDVEVAALLRFYRSCKNPVVVGHSEMIQSTITQCLELWEKDYVMKRVPIPPNMCSSYPPEILVPVAALSVENEYQELVEQEIIDAFCSSSNGRARGRFIVPSILIHNESTPIRSIFRSAALIQPPERLLRKASKTHLLTQKEAEAFKADSSLTAARSRDESVMRDFRIRYISDMMVEKTLTKCFGLLQCVSSEKAEENGALYESYSLLATPYPGWELFSQYKKYCVKKGGLSEDSTHHSHYHEAFTAISYEWKKRCSAPLNISSLEALELDISPPIQWEFYQEWNIVELTASYMALLHSIISSPIQDEIEDVNGLLPFGRENILIHCISGWDRTPLFVSLLRLSLWVDGLVHPTLSETEIIYLTIAYDWMLFGHDLHTRAKQSVELLYFCFHILPSLSCISPSATDPDTRSSKLESLVVTFTTFYFHK